MAKYSGLLKLFGKFDSFVFVGGSSPHVRSWDSSRTKKMKMDVRFKTVRLVQSDFGLASTIGKKMRMALQPLTSKYKDATLSGRLTGALFGIINKDVHPKGERVCDFKKFGSLLTHFEFHPKNYRLDEHLSLEHEIGNGAIRFSQFQLLKKGFKGVPYLDFVCLLVPEQISALQPGVIWAQFDSFRITDEKTVAVNVPQGMVGLVFVGLHFKKEAVVFYSGMKLLEVVY